MRVGGVLGALALAGGCLAGSAAWAADWQIATVSGKAYRLSGTDWVRITAAEPIALGDTVRTLGSGRLTLTRDGVTITIAPNSQLQIRERMNGKFTDVLQSEGSADVEVDPARHIRLAVETPYMAAVVKGTVFAVSTYRGYSETAVRRGRVAVIDVKNRMQADVTAGQTATSGEGQPLSLSGSGKLQTPQTFHGKVVTQAADGTLVESKAEATESPTIKGTGNGAGKTVTSNAGGDGAGKSENSNAGGNSGKGSSGDKSGNSNSGSGNNSGNGNSGNGNSGNGNGNSGNGNSGNGNSGHGNSGNGNGNSGNSGNGNGNSGNGNGNSGHGHGSDD